MESGDESGHEEMMSGLNQDMVKIGTTTPDEAKEVLDPSLDLQVTRSKRSLETGRLALGKP